MLSPAVQEVSDHTEKKSFGNIFDKHVRSEIMNPKAEKSDCSELEKHDK